MSRTLYVVATPIGNLDDLTIRASKKLGEVDFVLAEDTRRTRQLLSHLGISKPIRTLNAHADPTLIAKLADEIDAGADCALVSDAGTPMVSDPGAELVRETLARDAHVIAVPGASAVLCALAASGLAGGGFRFVGFLPRAGGDRSAAIAMIVDTPEPVVLYEAGNRVSATIADLAQRAPDRAAAIGRELTKLHEEWTRGTLSELARSVPESMLGEVTIVLGAAPQRTEVVDETRIDAELDKALAEGRGTKEAADIVAALCGRPRREVYARAVARKQR